MSDKENKNPIISIIIPCYNCESMINETLSALEVQCGDETEIICINDGSKDATLNALLEYKSNSSLNMVVLDQENAGVSATRNRGIKEASGDYIIFLDADDILHKDYLSLILSAKEKSGADCVYCLLSREKSVALEHDAVGTSYEIQDSRAAMDNLLYRMGEVGFYCYLYNRQVLIEKEINFEPSAKFGEDREFNWKYLCHCKTFAFIEKPLYWYRPNMASATKSKASWRNTDALAAMKRVEAYMEEQKCEYLEEFKSYMYARVMWSVAKNFAASKDKELFARLANEYDVKSCMKITAKDSSKLVALASILYLINPKLFFLCVSVRGQK